MLEPGNPNGILCEVLIVKIKIKIVESDQTGKKDQRSVMKQTEKGNGPAQVPGILHGTDQKHEGHDYKKVSHPFLRRICAWNFFNQQKANR
ncbi:MAG: hypothetical protein QGG38_09935, partial [Nitrospinaceae bacterium]|nr:hypothetical protein [Nitrospinaceae bacterium]